MKGGKFIYGYRSPNNQPAQVALALTRCQGALRRELGDNVNSHLTDEASCAGLLAIHQYHLDPTVPDAEKTTLPTGTLAAAYGDGGNT